MKKKVSLLLAAVLLSLSACSGGGNAPSEATNASAEATTAPAEATTAPAEAATAPAGSKTEQAEVNSEDGNDAKTIGAAEEPAADLGADGPITLTLFDKNTGDAFTNPVSQEIIKRTGINIEVQQPTGNPDEKLNLMLISGDLPDILLIDRREATLNKYITSGALLPLNDLTDQYAPNIKAQYGDVLAKSVFEDGKNYYFNNWYGLDPDPNWSVGLRMDLLAEFGLGKRAMDADSFTQDELVSFLKWFKETYPGDSAAPALPLTADASYMPSLIGTFKAMYGMKTYYEGAGRVEFDVRDPKYPEMLKFINMLANEGLLDPEWGVNNTAMATEKEVAGRVAARIGGVGGANELFLADYGEGTEHLFYQFNITAPGVDRAQTTYGPRSSLGWDGVGISVSNEHPIETIKFLDFLASEEGQYLLMWGVEGQTWNMANGVHTPTQEALDSRNEDWAAFSLETGARKWTWMIKNGYGEDGTPHDFMFRYQRNKVDTHGLASMAGTVWDTALYDDIGPTAGTPEALQEQKVLDSISAGFAKIVNAKPEDVEPLYNALITDIDRDGAKNVEDIYTERFAAKMALYNDGVK